MNGSGRALPTSPPTDFRRVYGVRGLAIRRNNVLPLRREGFRTKDTDKSI